MPPLCGSFRCSSDQAAAQLALAVRTNRAPLWSSNAARAFPRNIGDKAALFLNEQCSPTPPDQPPLLGGAQGMRAACMARINKI
ncbi:MAG: hypothetical protein WC208_00235 [Gallionella sp.]